MTRWDETVFDPYLPADLVLRQAEIGVIAADQKGNVILVKEHTVRLLGCLETRPKLVYQPPSP